MKSIINLILLVKEYDFFIISEIMTIENYEKFFLGKKPPKILISYKVAFYSDMAAAYRMINRFMMSLKSGTTNWQKKVYFYLLFDLHFSVSCSA